MSEQTFSHEQQEVHLSNLLGFINQPDEEIVSAGYKEAVLTEKKSILFNSDLPEETRAYKQAFTTQKELGLVAHELVFDGSEKDREMLLERFARAAGLSEERIRKGADDLEWEIGDYFDEQGRTPIFFLRNFHLLSVDLQGRVRAFRESRRNVSMVYFGLASRTILDRQQWKTSPLWNIFSYFSKDKRNPLRFDAQKGSDTIAAYRQAINQLKSEDSARVVLPSRTGKSIFAGVLSKARPNDVFLIDLQYYLVDEGRRVTIDKLPSNHFGQIVFLDEATALTDEQRQQLVERYGRVIFIENADYLRQEQEE